jgi:hypothetical protein
MNTILFSVAMTLIFIALCGICFAVSQVNETLEKVLQRWAALDNLGLFPAVDELKEVGFAPGAGWVLDENQRWRRLDEVQRG